MFVHAVVFHTDVFLTREHAKGTADSGFQGRISKMIDDGENTGRTTRQVERTGRHSETIEVCSLLCVLTVCVFMVFLFIWVSHGIPVYMGFSFFVPFLSPLRLTADTIHATLDQISRDWLSNHGMGPQVLFTFRQ